MPALSGSFNNLQFFVVCICSLLGLLTLSEMLSCVLGDFFKFIALTS